MSTESKNKPKTVGRIRYVGFSYCLPFIILLFGYPIALVKKGGMTATASQIAFLSNPINLIVLGSGYLFASILFLKRYKRILPIISSNKAYLLSLLFVLVTAFVSSFPLKVAVNWFHYVGLSLAVVVATLYFSFWPERLNQVFTFWAFFVVYLSIALALFFPSIGIHHIEGRWMGVTSNPNSLGGMCVITVWASIAGLRLIPKKKLKILNIMTLLGAFFCLYKANSVTGIICSLFIAGGIPLFISMKNDDTLKIIMKLFFAFIFCVLIVLIVWAVIPEMLGLDIAAKGIGRDATLSGRTTLWAHGMKAFAQRPLLGWGFDANATILSSRIIQFGQFHNGYINLAVAGGTCGIVFLTLFIARLLSSCIQVIRLDFELGAIYLILALALLIHNIAEASFYSPTSLLWLMFVFAMIYLERYSKVLKQRRNVDSV